MSGAATDPRQVREVRKLLRGATANLTDKQARGRDRKVRRDSYDVGDRRAQVFTKVADGTRAGGLGFIDDIVRLAEEYDLTHRKPGERPPLMATGVRVLKVMLEKFLDFQTGQLDPAVGTIAKAAGCTYKAAHAALKRLDAHGFLGWVRRTRKSENAGDAGPQREQVSNAYHFKLGELPVAVLRRWRDLRERRRRRLATAAPIIATPATPSPELAAVLARLEEGIERESRKG